MLTENFGYGRDHNWAIGYVVAHEFLHQLLQKADYYVNKRSIRYSIYGGHINLPLNLNTEGTFSGLVSRIGEGYNPCSQICHIKNDQFNLIRAYINLRK
jgi:hypothetical protein